ncbi:MAG: adenine deaminase [Bacteroidales bacterium]
MKALEVSGYLPILPKRKFIKAKLHFNRAGIISIEEIENCPDQFILPGLIDAHVHIESSLVLPDAFGFWVSKFGTIACLADPHEIANVLGLEGIEFMIKNARRSKVKFFFGASSCVPATPFETSGAKVSSREIHKLLSSKSCYFLSEMMNFPGVIHNDPEILEKLNIARTLGFRIDGHAPLLRGQNLQKYVSSGITSDHECASLEEAREKIALGMKIQIRNGSAARNFQDLHPLIPEFPNELMFCTDDCHPDELVNGHIDNFVRWGLKAGYSIFDLIKIASVNPVKHYQLPVGLLETGDPADFIIVKDLQNFEINETWINGEQVFSEMQDPMEENAFPNKFFINEIPAEKIRVKVESDSYKTILVEDGQLLTGIGEEKANLNSEFLEADPGRDILKLVVLNRYQLANPQIAFVQGFGLKYGALASSCAHDSHNIIAVGADDQNILKAIRLVQENRGGLVAVNGEKTVQIPLPVAGLMSGLSLPEIALTYKNLNEFVKNLGSTLKSPFMTLSFMALLVIPELKLGDRGLFDGNKFSFVPLFNQ